MRKTLQIFLLLTAIGLQMQAQRFSPYRVKSFVAENDTISIDTLSIIPQSIIITTEDGISVDTSKYTVDYARSVLFFTDTTFFQESIKNKTITLSYKVFPMNLSAVLSHKKTSLINTPENISVNPFLYKYESTTEDVFKWGTLNRSGSISRGISFGNNQDVVVNSSFNLQLSGYLSEDIQVLAAITDNNIPIQPDGNTQQLQDFDKVYIQLFNKNNKLIAGDFETTRPKSYFMNFYKKAQGALIESNLLFTSKKNKENQVKLKIDGCGAVSKGRYARNVLTVIEGNQGPYKLKGANNETFIIVLAGTERVYIDGVLQTRGQENDYVIDYNVGEISFTPKNIITKDKRVVVEFEYTDRYYARTLFYTGVGAEYKKLQVQFNFYSEQDLKNQPLQQDLSNREKELLYNVGDSVHLALLRMADSIAFSDNYVMYKMIDTVVNGITYDSVFVYSTSPDSAFYRPGFSYVGTGKGNYVLAQSAANGRVFKWVVPQNGMPAGDYEPVTLIIAPKKQQMYTLGASYEIGKTTKINVETALSNLNKNLFSPFNKKDDWGMALKADISNNIPFAPKNTNEWKYILQVGNEWVSQYFTPIEQYRPVEFNRDWNLHTSSFSDENLISLSTGVQNKKNQRAIYRIKYFTHGSEYKGLSNQLDVAGDYKNFFLVFNGSYLLTKNPDLSTRYLRQKASLVKKFRWFNIGVGEEQEHNRFLHFANDSLTARSFAFNVYEAFLGSADTAKFRYKIGYKKRFDYLPANNKFVKATDADDFNAEAEYSKNPKHIVKLNTTYRILKINDTTLINLNPDRLVVGRIEYFTKFAKNVIQSTTFYEVGSGMEEKKDFSYLEVPSGQGVYTWTDYNGDGIKQLNEFEVAAFKDQANYIRIFTPTNKFIKTYSNEFSEAVTIDPAVVWRNKSGLRKFLSRYSLQSSYSVSHKSTNNNLWQAYNPFSFRINDTTLMSLTSAFRTVLFFNKSHPKFAMEVSCQFNNSKVLLLNGFESRRQENYGLRLRWNITKKFYTNLLFNYGFKDYHSEFFSSRNYNLQYWEGESKFIFQPNNKFRIGLTYNYTDKTNSAATPDERSVNHNFGIDSKYNFPGKGTLQGKINYINIAYNAEENTSVAYEMLGGLKKGNNFTWGLTFQRTLGNNLQLDLVYDGRKAGTNKMVHVGSVQLRAYF